MKVSVETLRYLKNLNDDLVLAPNPSAWDRTHGQSIGRNPSIAWSIPLSRFLTLLVSCSCVLNSTLRVASSQVES